MKSGQKIKVQVPGGSSRTETIPPRHKWVYLNTGQPAFDIQCPTKPAPVVVAGTSSPYQPQQPAIQTASPYQPQQQQPPKMQTIRIGIPKGMKSGQKIKVQVPGGSSRTETIPPRHKWVYLNTGQPAFDIQCPTKPVAPVVVAGTYVKGGGSHVVVPTTQAHSSSVFSPWKRYEDMPAVRYQPPVLALKDAPVPPPNMSFVKPSGRRRALIIGINYTGTRAALRGCVNDAKNMRNLLLRNNYPNDSSHIVMLTDERGTPGNYKPTRANIFKAMQWLVQGVSEGDVLFFHFSGHGAQVPDRTGHEADGLNETILPLDYQRQQITDDELWGTLVYPLPAGARLTALMDCCHSGTGLDLPFEYKMDTRRNTNRFGYANSSYPTNGQWIEDINPAHSQGDVVLFSGCEDGQTSADTYDQRQAGGAMTQSFISAYEENPYATYPQFMAAINSALKQRRFKQRPQLTASQPFNVKERVFSLVEGIEPNHNHKVGRIQNRHIRPGRAGGGGGGPMDAILLGAGAFALGGLLF